MRIADGLIIAGYYIHNQGSDSTNKFIINDLTCMIVT